MMMNKVIGKYQNGNYMVTIYSDGTKVRETSGDKFIPEFAENVDINLTNKCDGGCKFCYISAKKSGEHGNIPWDFINSLHPYTELALNVNDLSHPELDKLLFTLKDKKVIANITVNQLHFERHYTRIKNYVDNNLVNGVGISLRSPTDNFIKLVKTIPNAVIHTIHGVTTREDYLKLANNNLKILILGYKTNGLGKNYLEKHNPEVIKNQRWLKVMIDSLFNKFDIISFDNLAIEELNVKNILLSDDYNQFFMGDEGEFTYYIDLVKSKFAVNSRSDIQYDLLNISDDMFRFVRSIA